MTPTLEQLRPLLELLAREACGIIKRGELGEPRTIPEPLPTSPALPERRPAA